jgi:glycosyltransferase involved in cell wall biosynthesis
MKILLVHNFYKEPGGEDVVFAQEKRLLERNGQKVVTYTRSNEEANQTSGLDRIRLISTIVSSSKSRTDIAGIISTEKPDIAHIHNTFMMVSPSIYAACNAAKVPVVQTLHNYRMLCPASTFCRNGEICEDCVSGGLLSSVRHACYRGSRASTAAVALMLSIHQARNTWGKQVNAFIALTAFAKRKFIAGGLLEQKIHVKPNFVDPDPKEREAPGDYALFAGRLSPEKGASTLLAAWALLRTNIPLKIAGDGPCREELEGQSRKLGGHRPEFLGRVSGSEARSLIRKARFLILPSLWYEGFPMIVAESFASGVPVIGSRLGAIEELIADGRQGLTFNPKDAVDLAAKVQWAWEHPDDMAAMGREARRTYEQCYNADTNYKQLMDIYGQAMDQTTQ